jgi:hypothetical protein
MLQSLPFTLHRHITSPRNSSIRGLDRQVRAAGIFSLEEEVGDEEGKETERGGDVDGDALLRCSSDGCLCCWDDFVGAECVAGLA